jgi:type I restriction-modification system DNA methylase subunit
MDRRQAIVLVRDTFTQRFDEGRFRHFLRNLVNHLDESNRLQFSGNLIKRAFSEQVGHYLRLGTYTDPRGERVDVLAIHLRKDTTLARGRVTLRNFVADYMATGHGQGKAAVIAAFVSPSEDDWRFSFIKLDYMLETSELGFVTERAQLTPARRYSYLVGENENCHTAQKQFLQLLETDSADPTVTALEVSFSVEKVTREFFEQYRGLFKKSQNALADFLGTAPKVAREFDGRGITADEFAKKLLGQIVFLYFLQKKGWFGVERGKPWGAGRKDFIRYLFNNRGQLAAGLSERQRGGNFFNDVLEPLFYEALATPRLDDDHYYSRFDCRIPFLNGGLFEPLYGYDWVETDILLPDSLFSNDQLSEDGDIGTGILDVFDRYNFTVNEAEPLEREVAVDPEMLGKVFENLLPENMRHSSGTYYTPRVIVHFMCQQALLDYLSVRSAETPRDVLAVFFRLAERFADFEAKETKNHADKRLPEAISANASRLDDLLATVTICDPAIGSGAFPVGMMHEIVRARMALTPALEKISVSNSVLDDKSRSSYSLKRHAIQQSLYGVDDDPGAVEIAKLRLWLSMVVDEDEIGDIQPLPNLDYKIMQGNSLLEEFDGVRLFAEHLLQQDGDGESNVRLVEIEERQRSIEREVASLQGAGRLTKQTAVQLKAEAAALGREQKGILDHSRTNQSQQHVLSLGSRGSLKRIQQLHNEFFDESSRLRKEKLRSELERMEWEFMRATLREQGRERALAELERASARHHKPFFLWKLHFVEVFQQRGGFDVIIANPPYVRMELIKEQKPALKRHFPQLYAGRADLYVYFYGLGLHILRDGGCLTFISSNSYLNSKFGEKLRECFLERTSIKTLIDFAETKVFDAVVEPAIILLRKGQEVNGMVNTLKWVEDQTLEDLPEVVSKKGALLPQTSFSSEPWQLTGGDTARVLAAIRLGRKTLLDHPKWKPMRGVVTGLNEAFVIDSKKRAEILKANPEASEIIHPFLRGRDIAKWHASFNETYLIYAYHGVDISRFPAVENHLLPFAKALKSRATEQEWFELQQPQMAYEAYFRGPKLVYQEINRTDAFAYDIGFPTGMFVNNKVFFIPNAPKALLALMNSMVASFFIHTLSGVPPGGFLALQMNIINPLPIPNWSDKEEKILETLTDYLLWLHRSDVASENKDSGTDETLLAGYFEQWTNALIYELFFPEELHRADLNFFRLAQEAELCPASQMANLSQLRSLFESLYRLEHPLRQSLYRLDSLDTVRIIEGRV